MNRIVLKSIAVAALVLVSAAVMAQDGGGRQGGGRRGGFGQGRGGVQTGAMLLFRNDVQADLQLTDEQKTKLTALRPARGQGAGGRRNGGAGAGGTAAGGNGGAGATGGAGAGGGQAGAEARRAEMQKQVAEILTPDQAKRLKEIGIQIAGVQAVVDPAVQKDLGLDTAQLDKIKGIQSKYQEAMTSVRQRMRSQEIDREKATEAMKTNNDTLKAEIEKVLTPAQAEKLKTLGGKPFKAEEQTRRGGGGRG